MAHLRSVDRRRRGVICRSLGSRWYTERFHGNPPLPRHRFASWESERLLANWNSGA